MEGLTGFQKDIFDAFKNDHQIVLNLQQIRHLSSRELSFRSVRETTDYYFAHLSEFQSMNQVKQPHANTCQYLEIFNAFIRSLIFRHLIFHI